MPAHTATRTENDRHAGPGKRPQDTPGGRETWVAYQHSRWLFDMRYFGGRS